MAAASSAAALPPAEMNHVVLPISEQLFVGAGTHGSPIMDVRFTGLAFTHMTWGRVEVSWCKAVT